MDLYQARADQIRPSLRLEGARGRLYHPDRQIWIRRLIQEKFVALTRRNDRRGDEIRPEFQSFESFLSESRRRQSETAFRREFDSFEDFVSDLRRRRRNDDQLQTETEAGPEFDQFEAFWYDLTAFDAFMALSGESGSEGSGGLADRLSDSDRENLLAGLSAVEAAALPEGEQSCPICLDKYHDDIPSATAASCSSKINGDDTSAGTAAETEPAIRLRCNHVFGKTCLASWLASGNTTCPFCRADVRTPPRVVMDPSDL